MNAITTSTTLPTVTLTAEAFSALSTKQIVALGAICVIAVTDGNAPAKASKAGKAGKAKTTAEAAVTGATRLNAAGRVVDATTGKFVKVPEGRVNTPKGKAGKPARQAAKKVTKAEKAKRAERAEARKAFIAKTTARKNFNNELAAWMRKNGVTPGGSAWTLAQKGDRSVAALRVANATDGLKAPTKAQQKAAKAKLKAMRLAAK